MVKMVTQKEARNFEISKLKNLLEKLWNLLEVTRIQTWFETEVSQLRSATPVVTWGNGVLGISTPMFIKPKGRKQYICYFLQYQILKAQKLINHYEYSYHVKQFILASANSYCNFYILFIYYVLYFPLWTSTLYFPSFTFFIDQTWKQVLPIQAINPCFIEGRSWVS